jgi:hypothetical protein
MPRKIGLIQAIVMLIVIYFIIYEFVPSTYTNVKQYGTTVAAIGLGAWWLYGYFR